MYLLIPRVARDTIGIFMAGHHARPVVHASAGSGTITFAGDTHGALDVSARILMEKRSSSLICFLGDIVDRGERQLENLLFILESAVLNRSVVIVRGNHESIRMNGKYGFLQELRKWGVADEVYPAIAALYGELPYACIVNGRILGVHGGIPESCQDLSEWDSLPMGQTDPEGGCQFQILWNDPSDTGHGFMPNPRGGGSRLFGQDAFNSFMDRNGLELLVRGHQVMMAGHGESFGGRLVTVFSSRYHHGEAALMDIDAETGRKSFHIIPER